MCTVLCPFYWAVWKKNLKPSPLSDPSSTFVPLASVSRVFLVFSPRNICHFKNVSKCWARMFVFLSQERVAAFVQVTCFERAIPSGHTHQCFHHKIFPGLMVVWCWLSKRDGGIGALSTYGENDKLLFTTLLTDLSQQSQQVPSEKKTHKAQSCKKNSTFDPSNK